MLKTFRKLDTIQVVDWLAAISFGLALTSLFGFITLPRVNGYTEIVHPDFDIVGSLFSLSFIVCLMICAFSFGYLRGLRNEESL